jgi:hypothetical protein
MTSARVLILQAMAVSLVLNLVSTSQAYSKPSDMLQYMNPNQKKTYLNQSQDRVIKKQNFKKVEAEGAQPIPNKEIGLFARLETNLLGDDEKLKALLADPRVNGLSAMIAWQQLEPVEDQYQWQSVDHLLQLCADAKKSLILRISTCGLDSAPDTISDTPKWVFDAGAKSLPYTGSDAKEHQMPIYWDPVYTAKWSNFVNAMGQKYDKNPAIHSIGITGGGVRGGTQVLPDCNGNKVQCEELEQKLKTDYKMSQQQLVQHWKYIADLFPHSFTVARLNFDVDPPTASRQGQDSLDEISDYLVYRYGERVYLSRIDVDSAKHGFDQYRVLIKFRPDTLTGYQLAESFPAADLSKLVKSSLDDGISFIEVPTSLLQNTDAGVVTALQELRSHLGYQLLSQKVSLPSDIKSGAPLKAEFTFINLGSATAMRPNRQFDKDVASSYKIQLELRDTTGAAVLQSLHTPAVPTNQWTAGKPIRWEEELKMAPLKPGEYSVWLSVIDPDTKHRLQILDAAGDASKNVPETAIAVGKIQVLPE